MPQIETTHIDAEQGEGAALLSPKPAKKSWSRAAPLVVLGASLVVLVGVASSSTGTVVNICGGTCADLNNAVTKLIKLPDPADLAGDFLGLFKKAPPPVDEVDVDAYTGRWYNVYYDLPTLPFSTPDCQTAFYAKVESEYPILTVNNSGLCYANIGLGCTGNPADYKVNGQTPTYITGHAAQKGGAAAGDLTLNLDGVGRDSTYRIAKLGPKTYGAGYYQYSVVSDDSGVILFVLARDVDDFFETYDDEVQDFLKKYDFKGPLFKPRKNVQDPSNCPAGDAIYFRQFDPASPPPVLAADQEATSSSCTRDAYGKCVPAGCASYFDGCNTCNVGTVLGCTMMYCDKPQEPKCLEYIGETEKN